jgi:hypothetical protein
MPTTFVGKYFGKCIPSFWEKISNHEGAFAHNWDLDELNTGTE